ncbi:MAG: hypothetical protein BGO01_04315 [Armatimonadetes bacterium 55-13]|nr:phytanoyl-CoA dioxygenase family protein [Armatimonadota bacterium]OJU63373.1 MAG: hypothetical protein BGO01_04315 [Armatimonadetes bacterium 55-13]
MLIDFESKGYCVVENVVSVANAMAIAQGLELERSLRKGGHSLRNLTVLPIVQDAAKLPHLIELVDEVLGLNSRLVRAIFFDKVPGANWSVPWHQDLTICVKEKHAIDGFGPWPPKDGAIHVQPPAIILEKMLTARIHLDDCGAQNGPVRVVPGSHRHGKIGESDISGWIKNEVACVGGVGSVLFMRPLLLHASSPAVNPSHRRVLHLEFAAEDLPLPLEWNPF